MNASIKRRVDVNKVTAGSDGVREQQMKVIGLREVTKGASGVGEVRESGGV